MTPEIRRYIEHFPHVYPLESFNPRNSESFASYIDRVCRCVSVDKEPHFSSSELLVLRKAGRRAPEPPKKMWVNIVPTLFVAEMLRAKLGPLVVGNGYRPKELNKKVGGSHFSTHIDFRALDLDLPDGHPLEKRRELYECAGLFYLEHGKMLQMGLGLYAPHEGTRVHIDTGRWWGRPVCWEPQYAKLLLASIR